MYININQLEIQTKQQQQQTSATTKTTKSTNRTPTTTSTRNKTTKETKLTRKTDSIRISKRDLHEKLKEGDICKTKSRLLL
jgi:hypothetical protein